ncbi:MAG: hypothetical protein AABX66_00870 [Nanoarchaeota archaeon]
MVSMTLAIPENMKSEMETFPEINWSEIARIAIKKRLELLKKFHEFSRDSEIDEKEALELGKKLNSNLSKKYKKLT